jgi:tartrate-resistant acid phosphatase type 5
LLDTDERDPDGATADSVQAAWLKDRLLHAQKSWKIVCAHHAPYTSHRVKDIYRMRWPFKQLGADAVLSGFFHIYERLSVDGIPYLINGAGGVGLSGFGEIDPNSVFRYNEEFGALMIEATTSRLTFKFINRMGVLIDTCTIEK